MTTSSEDSDAKDSQSDERRNSRLVILNGGLMQFAMSFASSETVIPAFIQVLTGSSILVGLSRSMMRVGWSWPQILISWLIEGRERKLPIFMWVGMVRAAVWLVLGGATWYLAGERPAVVLGTFFVLYAITTSLMGVSNVAWMDLVGKTVQKGSRAKVFALRRLLGGGMAIASGAAISFILSDRSGLEFPRDYAVLFLISAGLYAIAIGVFALIREPIEPVRKGGESIRSYLVSGFRLLQEDDDYRRLFVLRYVWAVAMMGTSFYVPFAISELGMDVVYIGLFVSVSQASSVLSNALWAWIGDRRGNRALLVYGTYLLAVSILIPVTTSMVPNTMIQPLAWLGISSTVSTQVLYFSLTFLFNGFASSGMFTGRMALVLDLSPPDRRPTYTSFMNTLGAPQGLLPILAGLLAAWSSYHNMFLISLAFIPLAIVLAGRIDPKKQDQTPTET